MAVLPTPGSPISTGLFLVRRERICMTRSSSLLRPMTGSSWPSRAAWVRLRPNWSRIWLLPPFSSSPPLLAPTPAPAGACSLRPATGGARRALVAGEQLDDLLAHAGQVGAELDEHLGGDALALTDEAEQDVLGADVVVAELERFTQGEFEHLLRAGVKGMWPDGDEPPWPMISSTWLRTASREMPRLSSAFAATPSPSWISPSRMCSVPM